MLFSIHNACLFIENVRSIRFMLILVKSSYYFMLPSLDNSHYFTVYIGTVLSLLKLVKSRTFLLMLTQVNNLIISSPELKAHR